MGCFFCSLSSPLLNCRIRVFWQIKRDSINIVTVMMKAARKEYWKSLIKDSPLVWTHLFGSFGFLWTTTYEKQQKTKQWIMWVCITSAQKAGRSLITYCNLTTFSRSGTKSFIALSMRESFDKLPYSSCRRKRAEHQNRSLESACAIDWCLFPVTSRKEMAAGSSCSRYVCVLAQRRARMSALLLVLSAYSNFSCSEPGGVAVW